MSGEQILEADLTWTGDGFEAGIQVAIGEGGRIERVGALGLPARRLERRALLPGMVNAHSHAFQRGLRGRGERFPEDAGSFWSWRREMYQLVADLDAESFHRLTVAAFREMRAAGITAVGEFHYLHHTAGERDWALDELVLEAAREAGIRLVLLNAFYRRGGFDAPLAGAQERFATPTETAYWAQMARLAARVDGAGQRLGAVAHSVRAASPDEIASLWREAVRRDLVFHIHLEEQRREIEDCVAAHGAAPLALLLDHLAPDSRFTAVHCTHSRAPELRRLLAGGGRICLCPLTEANLGDGIPDLPTMLSSAASLSLGTDSNSRISMTEEMRWLEYVQRLARERRGVVRDGGGRCAAPLFRIATEGGAASLGLAAGRIAAGCWADLLALDLDHSSLADADRDRLLEAFVFGAADGAIAATAVGGRWSAE